MLVAERHDRSTVELATEVPGAAAERLGSLFVVTPANSRKPRGQTSVPTRTKPYLIIALEPRTMRVEDCV